MNFSLIHSCLPLNPLLLLAARHTLAHNSKMGSKTNMATHQNPGDLTKVGDHMRFLCSVKCHRAHLAIGWKQKGVCSCLVPFIFWIFIADFCLLYHYLFFFYFLLRHNGLLVLSELTDHHISLCTLQTATWRRKILPTLHCSSLQCINEHLMNAKFDPAFWNEFSLIDC